MSHELKTPLTAVSGHAQLPGPEPPPRRTNPASFPLRPTVLPSWWGRCWT
ncbi:hypothetical protein [Oscillibacter sp.]